MPNLRRPVYSAQIGSFMDTPERAALIKAWAEHANVTHGAIMRDVVSDGLPDTVKLLWREHGDLPTEVYDKHLQLETERGRARAEAGAAIKRESRLAEKTRKPARRTRKAAA
jgi:hypothetical protein